jgi:leucyl-tRNA---protein transferase
MVGVSSRSVAIQELLRQICWPLSEPHACPYLPGREAREEVFSTLAMDPEAYPVLMDLGWRRSGTLFYRPRCEGCRECVPIRVPTATFERSRSQNRVWRRNTDVSAEIGRPELTEEKWALYVRYLRHRHNGAMGEDGDTLARFLYHSPVHSQEVCYRLDGRLIGTGILDVSSQTASTVYFFFDPDVSRRSPGVYSILWEIEWCRTKGIPYYYLGFYVKGAPAMSYKADYRPFELLGEDGQWRPGDRSDP